MNIEIKIKLSSGKEIILTEQEYEELKTKIPVYPVNPTYPDYPWYPPITTPWVVTYKN